MKFPLFKISSKQFDEDSILFDTFMFTFNNSYFETSLLNQEYCDCLGNCFQIIGRKPPTALWRKLLYFLPNVYKSELVFKSTGQRISLAEFKERFISGIRATYVKREDSALWIEAVQNASSIEHVLHLERL